MASGFMRADSPVRFRKVTVVAQYLKPLRVSIPLQPGEDEVGPADSLAMRVTSSLDVVDSKEGQFAFSAARATRYPAPAVRHKGRHPRPAVRVPRPASVFWVAAPPFLAVRRVAGFTPGKQTATILLMAPEVFSLFPLTALRTCSPFSHSTRSGDSAGAASQRVPLVPQRELKLLNRAKHPTTELLTGFV